jgi:hypothetical protein
MQKAFLSPSRFAALPDAMSGIVCGVHPVQAEGGRSDGTNGAFIRKGVALSPGENQNQIAARPKHAGKMSDSWVRPLK